MDMEQAREIVAEHGGIEVGDQFEEEMFGTTSTYTVVELEESGSGIRGITYDVEVAGQTVEGERDGISKFALGLKTGGMERK